MFKYAANNTANATDFGWYGKYVDSSVTYYSGMFRDATDNKMRFFTSTQVEPTTTVDTTGTGYAKADVVVGDVDFTSGTMRGHILPDVNDAYDIGSAEFKIRDMYVSDSSLWVIPLALSTLLITVMVMWSQVLHHPGRVYFQKIL